MFKHQMSLSKSKCWYSNDCLHFLKCAVPLGICGIELEWKLLFSSKTRDIKIEDRLKSWLIKLFALDIYVLLKVFNKIWHKFWSFCMDKKGMKWNQEVKNKHRRYSVYFEYLLVYRYSDLLPTNTNEELFGYFWLFVIFSQLFDEQYRR